MSSYCDWIFVIYLYYLQVSTIPLQNKVNMFIHVHYRLSHRHTLYQAIHRPTSKHRRPAA